MRNGFEQYFKYSDAEIEEIWKSGFIVFDTNAILSLFRDKKDVSEMQLQLMKKLRERLWIPHTVADEFHRNRLKVVIGNEKIFDVLRSVINDAKAKFSDAFNKVKKDYHLHPVLCGDDLAQVISTSIDDLSKKIDEAKGHQPVREHYDILFKEVVSVFEDRTGAPIDEKMLSELLKEGKLRCEQELPPGFVDYKEKKDSSEKDRLGDFLIWKQMILFAKEKGVSVIFVTDDMKRDWWQEFHGEKDGPHFSMLEEFQRDTGGQKFLMYNRSRFLHWANKYVKANVRDAVIKEVEGAERVNEERAKSAVAVGLRGRFSAFPTPILVRKTKDEIATIESEISDIAGYLSENCDVTDFPLGPAYHEYLQAQERQRALLGKVEQLRALLNALSGGGHIA